MDYREIPTFIASLQTQETLAAQAFQFLILTATRLSEVTGATWSEIDLPAAVWTIPARRMKAGKEHRVPLSLAAMAILKQAAEFRTGELIFPGRNRVRSLSGGVFRNLVPSVTVHGFRSSFRDWCAERTNFPRELCEAALAHQVGNSVEQAYRRTDFLEKRRELMDQWADFLQT